MDHFLPIAIGLQLPEDDDFLHDIPADALPLQLDIYQHIDPPVLALPAPVAPVQDPPAPVLLAAPVPVLPLPLAQDPPVLAPVLPAPPAQDPLVPVPAPVLPEVLAPIFNMAKISLQKFHGLSTDNASRFLLDFESYSILNQLAGPLNDTCKVAAFHLHLSGPALTWYNALPQPSKDTWGHLNQSFDQRYVAIDAPNNPALVAEAEVFAHVSLLPGQSIDVFHSLVVEKGTRLQKQARDILVKFIEGLPPQLAFFVRAGNPGDHHTALAAAQMGEAYGYRVHTPVMANALSAGMPHTNPGFPLQAAWNTSPSFPPPPNVPLPQRVPDDVAQLRHEVQQLTHAVASLRLSGPTQHPPCRPRGPPGGIRPSGNRPMTCYYCHAPGHPQRLCNWTGQGQPRSDLFCDACSQYGHSVRCCKLANPAVAMQNASGN